MRVKAPLPREVERYTIERCCLQAKLMPSHSKVASAVGEENQEELDDEEEEEDDVEI